MFTMAIVNMKRHVLKIMCFIHLLTEALYYIWTQFLDNIDTPPGIFFFLDMLIVKLFSFI